MDHRQRDYDRPVSRPDENYYPSRWSVSSNVELEASDVDLQTGQILTKPGRRRRQSKEMQQRSEAKNEAKNDRIRQKEAKKKGIRIPRKVAVISLMLCFVTACLILLAQYSVSVTTRASIGDVRKKIGIAREENNVLQAELDANTDGVTICKYASQTLGMLPAESVKANEVTIPDTGEPEDY